jgi:hypothetical protein
LLPNFKKSRGKLGFKGGEKESRGVGKDFLLYGMSPGPRRAGPTPFDSSILDRLKIEKSFFLLKSLVMVLLLL